VPGLFAVLAGSGLKPVDLANSPLADWTTSQLGLSCSIRRRINGASGPFSQSLDLLVSPLVGTFALPADFVPSVLRMTNRAEAVAVPGVDLRLSVYWFAASRIELADLAEIMALPDFSFGGAALAAAGKSGSLLATADMPANLAPGADIALPIGQLYDRWGTILIVPWVARVTVSELAAGQSVGLCGIEKTEAGLTGSGWVPNLTLEV
jgi:hypothetical protein